jgi:hypothetical protein
MARRGGPTGMYVLLILGEKYADCVPFAPAPALSLSRASHTGHSTSCYTCARTSPAEYARRDSCALGTLGYG